LRLRGVTLDLAGGNQPCVLRSDISGHAEFDEPDGQRVTELSWPNVGHDCRRHYACCICDTLINHKIDTAIHSGNDCHAQFQTTPHVARVFHKDVEVNVIAQP